MKVKLFVIVIGLFLFPGLSLAQYQSSVEDVVIEPNFWFGPKVGVNIFTPPTNLSKSQSQLDASYLAGIFLQFGSKFYFQPEFYYAVKNEKTATSTNSHNNNNTIGSLNVPLLLGVRLFNLGVISAHIMAGPSASFLLKESIADPLKTRQKSSFDLQAGGGIELFGFLTFDVRYTVDINDEMDEQIKQLGWDNGVNVTLGLKL